MVITKLFIVNVTSVTTTRIKLIIINMSSHKTIQIHNLKIKSSILNKLIVSKKGHQSDMLITINKD